MAVERHQAKEYVIGPGIRNLSAAAASERPAPRDWPLRDYVREEVGKRRTGFSLDARSAAW